MISLLVTLALAVRLVVCAFRVLASVAKKAAGGGSKAARARPSPFPAVSLLDPVAGKIFSLLTAAEDLAQAIGFMENFRSERADWGQKPKNFPVFGSWQGSLHPG
jgi:hypothetical protein